MAIGIPRDVDVTCVVHGMMRYRTELWDCRGFDGEGCKAVLFLDEVEAFLKGEAPPHFHEPPEQPQDRNGYNITWFDLTWGPILKVEVTPLGHEQPCTAGGRRLA